MTDRLFAPNARRNHFSSPSSAESTSVVDLHLEGEGRVATESKLEVTGGRVVIPPESWYGDRSLAFFWEGGYRIGSLSGILMLIRLYEALGAMGAGKSTEHEYIGQRFSEGTTFCFVISAIGLPDRSPRNSPDCRDKTLSRMGRYPLPYLLANRSNVYASWSAGLSRHKIPHEVDPPAW
jgi:hypothetical protein